MSNKILILLWKDLQLRTNNFGLLFLEIAVPIVIFLAVNLFTSFENHLPELTVEDAFEPLARNSCIASNSSQVELLFWPSEPVVVKMMEDVACYTGYQTRGMTSDNISKNEKFNFVVKFQGLDKMKKKKNKTQLPASLSYVIYPTHADWLNAHALWDDHPAVRKTRKLSYVRGTQGFQLLHLKVALDLAFLAEKSAEPMPQVQLQDMEAPAERSIAISFLVGIALFFQFAFMIPSIVGRIVHEKDTGAKELMLMMGIKRWHFWTAKLVDSMAVSVAVVTIMILFLSFPLNKHSFVFRTVQPWLVWIILVYGFLGVVLFMFFISCLFKSPQTAQLSAQIMFGLTFWTFSIMHTSRPVRFLMCLFPQECVNFGFNLLMDFEHFQRPLNFSKRPSISDDHLYLSDVLIMMTVNIILYAFLTWYLDNINPGKYGIAQPAFFCFQKSYWCSQTAQISNHFRDIDVRPVDKFERVPRKRQAGVSTHHLWKSYRTVGANVDIAVKDFHLDFFYGEITSVLGHNGAGKTTVFSMITGLTRPTSGRIFLNGYDLALNADKARERLGFCPQNDMLFSQLTAAQTIKFFGMVKGLSSKRSTFEAKRLIKDFHLNDVKYRTIDLLTESQKRKISLAISVIGKTEVLVLDEPTSGADPETRKEMWDYLLNLRSSKTILLTTHQMEEADVLSDRIAIMDRGMLQCYGSPAYLRATRGADCKLKIVLASKEAAEAMTEFVTQQVPRARRVSLVHQILTLQIPEKDMVSIPGLFVGLDEKRANGEISSYNVATNSLEDVFLKLQEYKKAEMLAVIPEQRDPPKAPKCLHCLQQVYALLLKKYLRFAKSFVIYCFHSTLVFVLIFLIYAPKKSLPTVSLTFSLNLYGHTDVLYSSDVGNQKKFEEVIRKEGSDVDRVADINSELKTLLDENLSTYFKITSIAVHFSSSQIKLKHNKKKVHMLPIAMNILVMAKLREVEPKGSITTTVNLSLVAEKWVKETIKEVPECAYHAANTIPDLFGVQTLFYMIQPLSEQQSCAKQLQLMTVSPLLYWFCHFLFDWFTYSVFVFFAMTVIENLQDDVFLADNIGDAYLAVLFWGAGIILLSYIISCIFTGLTSGYSGNLILYILIHFFIYDILLIYVLANPDSGLPVITHFHPTLIYKMGTVWHCLGKREGNHILEMALFDVLLFAFLVLFDSKLLSSFIRRGLTVILCVAREAEDEIDADIRNEEAVVKTMLSSEQRGSKALIAHQLQTWYYSTVLGRIVPHVNVSFAVDRGECFGIFGLSGVGKSTLLKTLAGIKPASGGNVYVKDARLSRPWTRQKYLSHFGYSPSLDGTIPDLQGQQLLKMFALLRGVDYQHLDREVTRWIIKLGLTEYADKQCQLYSHGNRRKLAVGVAFIGDPPVVLLDEPTSGVDPAGRRLIQDVIRRALDRGQAVVLASQSLDECQLLCTRLAVMSDGKFCYLGDFLSLKRNFGEDYRVRFKIMATAAEEDVQMFKEAVEETFGLACVLTGEFFITLQYSVAGDDVTWSQLFANLEQLKNEFKFVESYSASTTTLEQILMKLARK